MQWIYFLTFEDMFSLQKIEQMFQFLDLHSEFDPQKVHAVLDQKNRLDDSRFDLSPSKEMLHVRSHGGVANNIRSSIYQMEMLQEIERLLLCDT